MEDLRPVLRPLASLLGKCEKAQQKLAPGTGPYGRMQDSVHALRLATALLDGRTDAASFSTDELARARATLDGLAHKTDAALARFPEGTAQHALLRNRLRALRHATLAVAAVQ